MFFNPLFISNASAGNSVDSTKENKFSNSNYLFANIINISKEQLSSSDASIKIDESNKMLFNNLKSGDLLSAKTTGVNPNQFLGNSEKLTEFLSNVLNGDKATTKKSSSADVSVVPEQIAQLVDVLNAGEKVTLPISNNGKEVFVEIQKFDKNFVKDSDSPKGIKLSDSKNKVPQFSDLDFNNVVSDISVSLQQAFSSEAFNMDETKINSIISKIENDFSKLESVQNDTFKPQKNILGNLISGIEREFELNFAESTELKNVIVAQFVKVINNNIAKENSTTAKADLIPLSDIKSNLKLTPKEEKVIKELNVSTINLKELKDKIETKLVAKESIPQFKSVLKKLNMFLATNSKEVNVNNLNEIAKEIKLTPKEIEVAKKITTEKVSLLELSKSVKTESVKANAPLAAKSLSEKLNRFLEAAKVSPKGIPTAEKESLNEIAKEIKLTPKEIEVAKKITIEKVSLRELSKAVKTESVKANAPLAIKRLSQKLDGFVNAKKVSPKGIPTAEKESLNEIAKEIKLTPKEIEIAKKITTEKVSLPELSKAVKTESVKPTAPMAVKSLSQKLDGFIEATKVNTKPIFNVDSIEQKVLSKEVNLTPTENKLIEVLNVEKVDLKELQKIVKAESTKNPMNSVLKELQNKLEKAENPTLNIATENTGKNTKSVNSKKDEIAFKSTIKEKVKSGIKNILNNSNSSKVNTETKNSEFLFTLKTEKSPNSFMLDDSTKVEKKSPELLGKSIYSSKESAELTKVQVLPINAEATKSSETKLNSDNSKNIFDKKITIQSKITPTAENFKESNFENESSSKNEQLPNNNNISSDNKISENKSAQTFAKSIEKQTEKSSKKVISEKESSVSLSSKVSESKVSETSLPKSTFAIHQNRNEQFNINQKVVSRFVDIRNVKEELSNLIQKGEKKTVEFQLTPDNLGKMTIKLEVVNKVISASIKVDSESTQQIVQNSLEGLKTTLNQNGVQYNSVNVSLSNSEEKNQRYFKQKRKSNNHKNVMNAEGVDETLAHKSLGYNKYDFIA